MQGDNLPSPSQVVQMYWLIGIKGMRLYHPHRATLDALRNSGIGLILDTGNNKLVEFASNPSSAASWVQSNVQPYYPAVNIKYIAVGNELWGAAATQTILPALHNINNALAAAGLSKIKVSTSVGFNVIADPFPPSSGRFFAQSYMVDVARFLESTNAPLLANVYPYFAYTSNHNKDVELDYATFQQPGTTGVRDSGNGLSYNNLFDAMVDAIHAALEKAGAPDVRVVVSETGWPSAGGVGASIDNARRYNQGLIDHVGQGTPKKPQALETFIFAMFNENHKMGSPIEKNFGLFYPDKRPVYPVIFPNNKQHIFLQGPDDE
ncbi:hypothetical protein PR202_ga12059 [Eleusine coracana subsp. coracana]|uniref:Glucan endo-1,3-beta-D-glucosidase n=1 Tax=Eleusine coracana subsp. coracana TaxID=191504 RepID=A0AAV5CB29_ELECO|nr:hypothetical protein PR202_ga12059 [Eleusine coracana subsp. coracana]